MTQSLKWLTLLALVVRSLIPLGYMLAPVGHGSQAIAIVICTANGAQQAIIDQDGKPAPVHKKSSERDVCPFAATAHIALSPDNIETAVYAYGSAVAYTPEDFALRAASRPGNCSARGPPQILT